MPTAEIAGNRIFLTWPSTGTYVPDNIMRTRVAKSQQIVGASFRKSNGVWAYPLDLVTCRDLRVAFKDELEIGPKLWAWAKEQADLEKKLLDLLVARDCDDLERLEKHAPLIWAAMNDDSCLEKGCPGVNSKRHKPSHRVMSHRYQKPVVKYCALARKAQNASQPGLGKTIETLAALVEADIRGLVLVVAPKTSLRTVWEPEVRRWLPGVPVFACTGGKQRRLHTLTQAIKAWEDGKNSLVMVVVNPEMIRTSTLEACTEDGCTWSAVNHRYKPAAEENIQAVKDGESKAHEADHRVMRWYEHDYPALFDRQWAGLIMDETHRMLLKVNLRSKNVTQVGTGAMLLSTAADAMKLGLSGTPWKGKSRRAWQIKHWLYGDVGLGASFWNWAKRMYQVDEVKVARKRTVKKISEFVADEETFNRWVDGFMIRHTKKEMAPWLPDKTYGGSLLDPKDPASPIGVWLDFEDAKQENAYRDMENDATVRLDNGLLIGNGILAEFTRLKQFATSYGDMKEVMRKGKPSMEFVPKLPSNKYDWLVEFLDEHGINGSKEEEGNSKVVVASQFTQLIDVVAADLQKKHGIGAYVLTGNTPDAEREQYVREFMSDKSQHRVFILNTWAGGVSVTLDAADDLVFLDETWTPDDQEQVEDRVHRTSRIHNVGIWYLRTRGTIDERIAVANRTNDDIQKRLLDGRRGVEFAKKLLGGN